MAREAPCPGAPERLQRLSRALRDAGVLGQVRIGASADTRDASPKAAPDATRLLEPLERGALVEVSGAFSCGRTALAYRVALEESERGGWIGWIDPADALDPRFAQRAGIPLERLLWVRRPVDAAAALRAAELVLKAGFTLVVLDLAQSERRAVARLGSACWVRLSRAARRARAAVLLLGPEQPLAGAFASARLEVERVSACFDRGLFEGYEVSASWARDRAGVGSCGPLQFRVEHGVRR